MLAELAADDPIVVYGAPRSGTTYLQQILNAHPDVFVSHEARVFGWLHQALKVLPWDDRLLLTHRDEFVQHLRAVLPSMIRDFYRSLAPDARYWGDKNPHYADPRSAGCLETVAALFPRSLFIHIIRDGRDVVSSLLQKEEEGKPWVTFEAAHFTWITHVDRGSTFGHMMSSNRYFQLRYEDLVTNDVDLSREIFRFLGLELHPLVEAFCRGQQGKRTPYKGPTRDLGKGVTASEWSSTLSLEEQARSLALIGPQLVRYGYETEASLAELRERAAEAVASPNRDPSVTSAKVRN